MAIIYIYLETTNPLNLFLGMEKQNLPTIPEEEEDPTLMDPRDFVKAPTSESEASSEASSEEEGTWDPNSDSVNRLLEEGEDRRSAAKSPDCIERVAVVPMDVEATGEAAEGTSRSNQPLVGKAKLEATLSARPTVGCSKGPGVGYTAIRDTLLSGKTG